MKGPLRYNPINPRYFTDDSGEAIYLTGMHIHNALADSILKEDDPQPGELIDFDAYLDDMCAHNQNFLRFWTSDGQIRELNGVKTYQYPFRYVDINLDRHMGENPVYDLDQFNEAYFKQLRERAEKARARGIYLGVMLFEGWSLDTRRGTSSDSYPWKGHPFHKGNNINGIDGNPEQVPESGLIFESDDVNKFLTTEHLHVQTLEIPEITAYQKKYVKKVVETLNDLDNILYEICNEGFRWTRYWQYEMVDYIHELEKNMPKQHPVWMSHLVPAQNEALYVSHAEAISPGVEDIMEPYNLNPPAADGRKVIIADTDHLGGFWGTPQWAWKSFMRGINPIFMDFWGERRNNGSMMKDDDPMSNLFGRPQYMLPKNWGEDVRIALGQTRMFAQKMNMNRMLPYGELCGTGYCLADPGNEYLIYAPEAGQFKLKLHGAMGPFTVEWFDPATGETISGMDLVGGGPVDITPPYRGEIVLHLKKKQ